MNNDAENEQLLQSQATAASLEEYDLETPLEQQSWWKPGLSWMFQDEQKLREWHTAQWSSLGYHGRRWK